MDYFVIYEVFRVKFNNKECSGRTSIEEKEYAIKNEFTYLSRNHARNYIQISLIWRVFYQFYSICKILLAPRPRADVYLIRVFRNQAGISLFIDVFGRFWNTWSRVDILGMTAVLFFKGESIDDINQVLLKYSVCGQVTKASQLRLVINGKMMKDDYVWWEYSFRSRLIGRLGWRKVSCYGKSDGGL